MVYQCSQNDCGKACVRDVLYLVFEDEDYRHHTLKSACDNFLDIRTELEADGLTYISYDIDDLDGIKKDSLPAIAQLSDGANHFVVIRRIKNGRVTFDDPQFGTIVLGEKEFMAEFTGKIMLLNTIGKVGAPERIKVFTRIEVLFFITMFLSQSFAFFFFFYFLSQSSAQFFSMISGLAALLLIVIQVVVSLKIRHKLDERILLPFVEWTADRDDAGPLSDYLNFALSRANKLVTYGVITILACLIMTSNGFFLSCMCLFAILIGISETCMLRQRRQVDRFCTHEENRYFMTLGKRVGADRSLYRQARKRADQYLLQMILTKILEVAIYSLLIYFLMDLSDIFTINFFLFNLMILFSLQKVVSSLVLSYIDDSKDVISLNSLSTSLSSFLIRTDLTLGYNNPGGRRDEPTKICDRLSGQDGSEEEPGDTI